jgi:hypothetical protein
LTVNLNISNPLRPCFHFPLFSRTLFTGSFVCQVVG